MCANALWAQATPDPGKTATGTSSAAPGDLTFNPKAGLVEDLTTPSLNGSKLVALPPLVGEVSDRGSYTRILVRLQWRSSDPIDVFVLKPTGVAKPPVILYLYSYPFDMDRFQDPAFCAFLTSNGFAAVAFPSALTGERYRYRPLKQWFVSELRESLATTSHDVQLILDYLATRGDIDMDHVGMWGDGSGAAVAILAASADPRIKVLDLLDPWGDWPDWIATSTLIPEKERPGFMKQEFLELVAPLDPVKVLPELRSQKIRIQHVKSVKVTPDESRKKIEAAAPRNAAIVHYDDAKAFATAAAGATGFDWIKSEVQGASAPQPSRANGVVQPDASAGRAESTEQ